MKAFLLLALLVAAWAQDTTGVPLVTDPIVTQAPATQAPAAACTTVPDWAQTLQSRFLTVGTCAQFFNGLTVSVPSGSKCELQCVDGYVVDSSNTPNGDGLAVSCVNAAWSPNTAHCVLRQTNAPATNAPATNAPATQAPAPATNAPPTDAPATQAPATSAPAAPCTTPPTWAANLQSSFVSFGTCTQLLSSAGGTINVPSGSQCQLQCVDGYVLDGTNPGTNQDLAFAVSCVNGVWSSFTAHCVVRQTTSAPATNGPTNAPATNAPVATDAPKTQAPAPTNPVVTDAPKTTQAQSPATNAPVVTDAPKTTQAQAPATNAPVVTDAPRSTTTAPSPTSPALPCTTLPTWAATLQTSFIAPGTCANLLNGATVNVPSGTTCQLQCIDGYVLDGNTQTAALAAVCTNGAWSSLSAHCVLRQTTAPATTNAPVSGATTSAPSPVVTDAPHTDAPKTQAPATTAPGTTAAPSPALPCLALPEWASTLQSRFLSWGTCANYLNAASVNVASGATCQLQCVDGYVLDGTLGDPALAVACTNGAWTANTASHCVLRQTAGPTTNPATNAPNAPATTSAPHTDAPKTTTAASQATTAAPHTDAPKTTTAVSQATTAAPHTTQAVLPTSTAGKGSACTGDGQTLNGVRFICVSPYVCTNGTCTDRATQTPGTTGLAPAGPNQPCTPSTASGVLQVKCVDGYTCGPNSVCVPKATQTASPAPPPPTVTPAPGGVGAACGVNRPPCFTGLVCTRDACAFPVATGTPIPATVSTPGGRCGTIYNAVCPDGYVCTSPSATANVATVGGTCIAKTTQTPVLCTPGQFPTILQDGTFRCDPCLYGTYSEKGLICYPCQPLFYTPVPDNLATLAVASFTKGPDHCVACPAGTVVPDQSCTQTPPCANCNGVDQVCVWGPPVSALSTIKTPQCVTLKCDPQCNSTTQACVRGQCTDLPAQAVQDPNVAAALQANANSLPPSVDLTATVQTTLTPTGTGGTTTVITASVTVDSTTVDATMVINAPSVAIGNAVVSGGSGNDPTTIISGNSQIFVDQLNVVNNGTPTTYTVVLNSQADQSGLARYTSVNLDQNNVLKVQGDPASTVRLDAVTGGVNAQVIASGITMQGSLDVNLLVRGDGASQAIVHVNTSLVLKQDVDGGTLQVNAQGSLTVGNGTTHSDVNVFSGTLQVSNGSITGSVAVSQGSIQINSTAGNPPHFDNFASCDGGVIYINLGKSCHDFLPADRKNTFTTYNSISIPKFGCRVILTGTDCQYELTVTTSSPKRRLLTTSSDCNQANMGASAGTYSLCNSKNTASRSSLSYFAFVVTLLVTLFLRY